MIIKTKYTTVIFPKYDATEDLVKLVQDSEIDGKTTAKVAKVLDAVTRDKRIVNIPSFND